MEIYITFVCTKKYILLTDTVTNKTPFPFVIILWGFLWIGICNYLLTPAMCLENKYFIVTFQAFSFQGVSWYLHATNKFLLLFIFHALTSIKPTHSPVLQLKSIFFQFSWPKLLQKCKLRSNTMHETWLRQSQTFDLQNIVVIPLHYFYPYGLDNRQTKACTSFVKLAASSINMLCYCPISITSLQRFQWTVPVCF